ncbi:hypothetical protein [Chitinophaga sp. LS1]|uniref:hypothetical protein n=1 Tax=Chitinophaga sp. LS1 TaxID=3051176 RepID=UPI002AABF15C|nr:hypothetical protein [Chitinophaga sp. LS1]WPV65399.1 hypothetical protein QQL36_26720 [Chitinophaga sp. LS1]
MRNNGFYNTEIFYTNEKNFCLIVYGYANIGNGIKKNLRKVKNLIKEQATNINYVDLTTLATEGFIEYKENNEFKYFVPRGSKGTNG